MTPTQQDYADAARLVGELREVETLKHAGRKTKTNWLVGTSFREWQPTADTEAGRSDALVLSRAVDQWWDNNTSFVMGHRETYKLLRAKEHAWLEGTMEEWLAANMAAAAAIGKHMGEGV